jgi:AcrR family transcriptional regulator
MASTTERRQELKSALIDAAERAISRRGLSGIKARDLAREAKCAVGAIYNVFPDLDALIFEVNARTLRLFETFLAAAGQETPAGVDGNPAVARLVHLATTYLEFAVAHHARWQALFEHGVESSKETVPEWYVVEQARLFGLVEGPLKELRPDLDEEALTRFARTLFSGVHGVVSLGLDAKLMALPPDLLRDQVGIFVRSIAVGQLAERADRPPR